MATINLREFQLLQLLTLI